MSRLPLQELLLSEPDDADMVEGAYVVWLDQSAGVDRLAFKVRISSTVVKKTFSILAP